MKRIILAVGFLVAATTAQAEEGGCFKYGAAGAVAGHYVGSGHGVLGAATGCIAGMMRAASCPPGSGPAGGRTGSLQSPP